jgi:ribonuclease HI
MTVVVDGGFKPNDLFFKAYGSYAVVRGGKVVKHDHTGFPTLLTCQQSEVGIVGWALKGLAEAIKEAGMCSPGDVKVTVKTDSQLVVGYFNGTFKRKEPALVRIAGRVDEIIAQYKGVEFVKVPRKEVVKVLGH